MKNSWRLVFSFILTGALSAVIAVGTYSYMDRKEGKNASEVFQQNGFRTVGFADAAENTDFTLAAEQSVHAVVHIKSIAKSDPRGEQYFDPFEFFFGRSPNFRSQPKVGFGSGVIISNDGYIVTNNHVIDGADEIQVTTNDDQKYTAKLIGGDEVSDVALLKIEGSDFPTIPFGDSDQLKVGQWVLAVGNPFNLTSTVTAGIVSAKGRGNVFSGYNRGNEEQYSREPSQAQMKVESYIQTDAAVNPGNSGGALVNTKGELVGINTAIYSETGNYVGYSFAIPMSIVKKVISDIKQYGVVQRAMLGVTIQELSYLKESEPDTYKKLKVTEGVYINGFSFGSSAKSAGIEIGDVITSIDGVKIKNFQELRAQISRYNPGNKVKVQIQRGNEAKTVEVELKNDQGNTNVIKQHSVSEILGATVKDLSTETRKSLGINFGIEVTGVSGGKFKEAGISKGFVILIANDRKISSTDSFEKIIEAILKQNPDDKGLFIKGFYPNGKMEYYAIDLNE